MRTDAVILEVRGGSAVALASGGRFLRVPDRGYAVGQRVSLAAVRGDAGRKARRALISAACFLCLFTAAALAAAQYLPWSRVRVAANGQSVQYQLNLWNNVLSADTAMARRGEPLTEAVARLLSGASAEEPVYARISSRLGVGTRVERALRLAVGTNPLQMERTPWAEKDQPLLLPTATPTPEPTPDPTPEATATPEPTAELTETSTPKVTVTPEPTAEPTETPTPTRTVTPKPEIAAAPKGWPDFLALPATERAALPDAALPPEPEIAAEIAPAAQPVPEATATPAITAMSVSGRTERQFSVMTTVTRQPMPEITATPAPTAESTMPPARRVAAPTSGAQEMTPSQTALPQASPNPPAMRENTYPQLPQAPVLPAQPTRAPEQPAQPSRQNGPGANPQPEQPGAPNQNARPGQQNPGSVPGKP